MISVKLRIFFICLQIILIKIKQTYVYAYADNNVISESIR